MISKKKIDPSYYCRVCGLYQDYKPWGDSGRCPDFNICFCCGAEFGYHDSNLEAVRSHRQKWLHNGGHWRDLEYKPPNWSLEDQMKNIPEEFK